MMMIERKVGETVGVVGEAPDLVWVVVTSKPGQEIRAKRELENQGFEVYLPMRLFENKAKELRAAPFFPRYLFARVPCEVKLWRSIFSTYGVSGVLGCTPARAVGISPQVVAKIKAREEAGFIKLGLPEQAPTLERGQRVTEPEWGLDGIFIERVDAKRAAILVSFMGRDSRFVVDLRTLKATEQVKAPPAPDPSRGRVR
jgi:transcriptional antiterminator RfaH